MYALRVADIPPQRSSEQEHKDGAASAGPFGVDIDFEESKLDLSLGKFGTKPKKTSKDDARAKNTVSIEGSKQLQPTIRQRRRLLKSPRQNPALGKQPCNDISIRLRDPEKHHIHFTEDYPDPLAGRAEDCSLPPERSTEPEKPETHIEESAPKGEETNMLPAMLGNNAARESPESEPAKQLEDPKHRIVLDHQDAAREMISTSTFLRGLARVKSISASLRSSAWTRRDAQSGTIERPPASKADPFASNDSDTPTIGFLTDEAMEHDRVRFANAFRSREAVRQQQQERKQQKSESSRSAASATVLRGGGGPGRDSGSGSGNINNWGFGGMPDWPFNMNEQMRQFHDDPAFAPFHNSYENHLDDGTYEYVHEFDYDSQRDGPIGGLGRGGGQGSGTIGGRQGGRQGGLCGLFGRRFRPPPEAAGVGRGDPMDMEFPWGGPPRMGFPGMGMGIPELMGPMGRGGRGMARPPRGGLGGRGGRGGFVMGPREMGGPGGFGMGYCGMGGQMAIGFPGMGGFGFVAIPIGIAELGEGWRGMGSGGSGGEGGESENDNHSSDSGDDGRRGDGEGGRGVPPAGDLDAMNARDRRRPQGGRHPH